MRVYSSAGRRRVRRRIVAVALVGVLLALALAATWSDEQTRPSAGGGATSPRGGDSGTLGGGEGHVPEPLSPSSDDPAVARLDSTLLDAVREAASDAGAEGITLRVTGGWRSARYQWLLLQRAVETYGSIEAARQYVLPPEESKHVTGEAVDIGPADAHSWLSQHGSEYGLCQIYANEPWHFELATEPGGTCPALISSAAAG